jgi:hypothetical protein
MRLLVILVVDRFAHDIERPSMLRIEPRPRPCHCGRTGSRRLGRWWPGAVRLESGLSVRCSRVGVEWGYLEPCLPSIHRQVHPNDSEAYAAVCVPGDGDRLTGEDPRPVGVGVSSSARYSAVELGL